jgi:hypothetical protein
MTFLNDLDPVAWVALFAAVIVFCSVTFLNLRDWRNHWPVDFGARLPIVLYLGVAFIVGACDSYSPNANAPRKTIEGVTRFVAETNGKGGYSEYVCVTSCEMTGGYALKLHGRDATAVKIGAKYVFRYLEKPVGNAVAGISLRVIEVAEPDSRRTIYQVDLTNHPYRVAAYLFDLTLLVCSGLVGALLRKRQREHTKRDASDAEDSDQIQREMRADTSISLSLESKDAS